MLVALRNKLNRKRSHNDLIYLKLVNRFQLEDVTSSQRERERDLQRFRYKYHTTS